ncbi:hypothetical protein MRX96_001826 [Rhipicephalus microplus]
MQWYHCKLSTALTFRFRYPRPSQFGCATYQLIACSQPSWKRVLKFRCFVPNCTVSVFSVQHVMSIMCSSRMLLCYRGKGQFFVIMYCFTGERQKRGSENWVLKVQFTEENTKLGLLSWSDVFSNAISDAFHTCSLARLTISVTSEQAQKASAHHFRQ